MEGPKRTKATALLANFVLGGLGLLFLALAWRMDANWAGRHFLPVWTWSWEVQLSILLALRLLAVLAGLLVLIGLRPWFVRACGAGRAAAALGAIVRVALAVLAALTATELVLRTQTWRTAQEQRNLRRPAAYP
jgi:hypothetical protein